MKLKPEKLADMQERLLLKVKHEFGSFLCLYTYYQRLIAGCADIRNPLTHFTK
jgi:hypothetical protein